MAIRHGLVICLLAVGCSSGGGGPGHGGKGDGGGGDSRVDFGSSSDGGSSSNPGTDGGSSGGSVYCGAADATECVCGTAPASGLTLGASCGPGDVSSPSLCCATAEWPNSTAGSFVDLGCVCSQIFCEIDAFGDVCQCGFAAPSMGDKPVSSCTGARCCRSRSTLAPLCACFTANIPCDTDEEEVASCAPSDLRCSDQEVSACH